MCSRQGLPCCISECAQRGQRTGDTSRSATGCFGGSSAHCLQRHPAPRRGSSSARSTVGLGHASEAVCRLLARTPAARRASSGKATRGWASFRCELDLAGPPGRCSPSCHYWQFILDCQKGQNALLFQAEWTPGKRVRAVRDNMPSAAKKSSAWHSPQLSVSLLFCFIAYGLLPNQLRDPGREGSGIGVAAR